MTAARQRAINIINLMPEAEIEKFIALNYRYEQSQQPVDTSKRIGAGRGKFNIPDDFDSGNEEIYDMLLESASKL